MLIPLRVFCLQLASIEIEAFHHSRDVHKGVEASDRFDAIKIGTVQHKLNWYYNNLTIILESYWKYLYWFHNWYQITIKFGIEIGAKLLSKLVSKLASNWYQISMKIGIKIDILSKLVLKLASKSN